MIKYKCNIDDFWSDHLVTHKYAREVPFVAKNFDHLDRKWYNRDFLLQSFNEELPSIWKEFNTKLNVPIGTVSWTCILPNRILPTHRDTFYTFRKNNNIAIDQCIRYLIFLEDWVFGQYVEFTDTVIRNWQKGDVWVFDATEIHYAVNASNASFHTCQISTEIS